MTVAVPEPTPPPGGPFATRALPPGEIHVWQADLDSEPADISALSDEERARLARMAGKAAPRFARSRVLLRKLLAAYSGGSARELDIVIEGEGKPRLAGGAVRFNLAHSGAAWIAAFAADREIGVDVERLDRDVDRDAVAARLFGPGEAETIRRLAGPAKTQAFFRCWTAREAIVKARGEGMFTLAAHFEVQADPELPLTVRAAAGQGAAWWIADVPAGPRCLAVVAAERAPEHVRSFGADPSIRART